MSIGEKQDERESWKYSRTEDRETAAQGDYNRRPPGRFVFGNFSDYGFQQMNLSKIVADTYSHNLRARQVLEKLGFQIEAIEKNAHNIYALLRQDWTAKGEENE